MNFKHPKDALVRGAGILSPVLRLNGFQFCFRGMGEGSGGTYAWGEFVRADRRLELHFRYTLGLVTWHVGDHGAPHGVYMRELGVVDKCLYPNFSDDPMDAFHALAHDIAFADDFLTGSATVLRSAAIETLKTENLAQRTQDRYGDLRRLKTMRDRFRAKKYRDVVEMARDLEHPDLLSQAEQRMLELARKKASRARNER